MAIIIEQTRDGFFYEDDTCDRQIRVRCHGNHAKLYPNWNAGDYLPDGVSEPVEGRWDNTHGRCVDALMLFGSEVERTRREMLSYFTRRQAELDAKGAGVTQATMRRRYLELRNTIRDANAAELEQIQRRYF